MSERMLKFVATPQAMPDKRPAAERRRDFDEIYAELRAREGGRAGGALLAMRRAVLSDPLPAAQQHPRLAEAHRRGPARGGLRALLGDQQLPGDLRPHLPAGPAVRRQLRHRESGHGTVTIGSVEKYITDTAWEQGWVQADQAARASGQTASASSAPGPAGLAAAEQLRAQGLPGHGLRPLRPRRRPADLRHPQLQAREGRSCSAATKLLRDGGVTFQLNCEVGRDVTLDELRAAPRRGADRDRRLQGARHRGARRRRWPASCAALDYLTASNRKGLGDKVPDFDSGALNAEGKNVVVIGGGDTAMDCVRTAVRQGAKSVKCLYRRDRANMPGSQREVKHAEEEGVEFVWLSAPQGFLGKDACQRTCARCASISACPTRPAARRRRRSRTATSTSRPTW